MPNIMINKICNLKCPYCFANKFVNKGETCIDENNISIENFNKAVEFITFNKEKSYVGIIGGEPTLHPNFKKFVKFIINNDKIEKSTLFTNGINLDKYVDILKNSKISVLINLNSPKDIGESNYKKITKNIEMFKENNIVKNINIGINLYDENMDYSFVIETAEKFNLKNIRISVVVPNTSEKRNSHAIEYFKRMKPMVLDFFKKCREKDIIVHYDCNIMPNCVLNKEEYEWVSSYVEEFEKKNGFRENLVSLPFCEPVIDILPNLNAVRCFGCSDFEVSIASFNNIDDLRNFFINKIDNYANCVSIDEQCKTCCSKDCHRCMGGCIAFKREKLEKLRDIAFILDR